MKKPIVPLNKGLSTDTTEVQRPKGTWSFALNTLLGSWDGDLISVTNEDGNNICYELPDDNYTLIGAEIMPNNNVVVFLTNNQYSIIGVHYTKTCEFKVFIKSACLNFRRHQQIDALTRVLRGCENIVYFTDSLNPYRSINLDDLDLYLNDGFTDPELANLDPDNGWNCLKFEHFMSYDLGCIKDMEVKTGGGNLLSGAYQFTFRYLDKNLNYTNWAPLSNVIFIFNENFNGDPYIVDGEAIQNVNNFNYTNKSISLLFSGLDTTFKYIQIGVTESIYGTTGVDNVYILDRVDINTLGEVNYIYTGFNPTAHVESTVNELTVPYIKLNVVEAHEQIDNRLLLANTKTKKIDHASLQRAVTLTKVKWSIYEDYEQFDSNPSVDKNQSVNPDILFTNKTIMSDEIYALGIVFLFGDGDTSNVYHIPGRPANNYNGVDLSTISGNTLHSYQSNNTPLNEWDTELIKVVPDIDILSLSDRDGVVGESNVRHIPDSEFINCSGPQTVLAPTVSKEIILDRVNNNLQITINGLSAGDKIVLRSISILHSLNVDDIILVFDSVNNVNTVPFGNIDFRFTLRFWAFIDGFSYPEQNLSTLNLGFPFTFPNFPFTETTNRHLGCFIERWKVHNTYLSLNPEQSEGYMGYHQNKTYLYEDVRDCNGDFIWDASSIGGENLVGTPIRHHRVPDYTKANTAGISYTENVDFENKDVIVNKLGLKADLTDVYSNIPLDIRNRIKGHYLVYGKRDKFNKTILDKGYMWNSSQLFLDPDLTTQDTFIESNTYFSNSRNIINNQKSCFTSEFISNNLIYNKSIELGDYVKHEKFCKAKIINDFLPGYGGFLKNKNIELIESYKDTGEYNSSFVIFMDDHVPYNDIIHFAGGTDVYPVPDYYQAFQGYMHKINNAVILPYNTKGPSGFSVQLQLNNGNGKQTTSIYELDTSFPIPVKPNGLYLGNFEVASTLSDLGLIEAANRISYADFTTSYVSIKTYKEVFLSLGDILYFRFENCFKDKNSDPEDIIKGGDTFITQFRYVKTKADRGGSDPKDYKGGAAMVWGLVESDDINASLSHSSKPNSQYAPNSFSYDYYLDFYSGLGESFNSQILWGDPGDFDEILTYGEFLYEYNKNFGLNNEINPLFPLDDNYNYCDQCLGEEPNKVYYSEKSNSEDIIDNYKLILANNSFTIPSETGEITNLFLEQDQLFCHTPKAMWGVQIRPQQLKTDESTLFVGTGGIGSIPPKRIVSTEHGYAGSIDKFATISTQYGTFFVDRNNGRLFLFKGGLNEVSKVGMEKWFRNNLKLEWNLFFLSNFGIEYPVNGTSWVNSTGYQAVYDPRHERIILHKKDFLPNGKAVAGLFFEKPTLDIQQPLPTEGELDTIYLLWTIKNDVDSYIWTGRWEKIDFTNKDFYRNEGWTVSYSLKANVWVSFHSYQPNFMYYSNDAYYSFINEQMVNNRVWKHYERNYQTYYGVKYEHIIDVINSEDAVMEKTFNSVQLISETYLYDNLNEIFVPDENVTFDKFYAYTSKQICSIRDLVVKTQNDYLDVRLPLNQTLIDRTENYWRFNRFRDEKINYNGSSFDTTWNTISTFYQDYGQGYIDKIPHPVNVDINKSIYQQSRLRDKYVKFRLSFKPDLDYKITTEMLSVLTNNSIR